MNLCLNKILKCFGFYKSNKTPDPSSQMSRFQKKKN